MAAAASVLRRQERRQEVREKKFFFNSFIVYSLNYLGNKYDPGNEYDL